MNQDWQHNEEQQDRRAEQRATREMQELHSGDFLHLEQPTPEDMALILAITDEIADDAVRSYGPECPARFALMQSVETLDEMRKALRAHNAECAICGCGRYAVVSERLALDVDAVCCEFPEVA